MLELTAFVFDRQACERDPKANGTQAAPGRADLEPVLQHFDATYKCDAAGMGLGPSLRSSGCLAFVLRRAPQAGPPLARL